MINEEIVTEPVIKSAEEIAEAAKAIYGAERVDYQEQSNQEFVYTEVVIHFPEVEMTNSHKAKHTIKDLFVRLTFSKYRNRVNAPLEDYHGCTVGMEGARTTYSEAEKNSSYRHSHLNGGFSSSFGSFCLGHSPMYEMIANIGHKLTRTNLELLFLMVDRFVRWESIEGGPYVKMEGITRRAKNPLPNSDVAAEIERIIESMPKDVWEYTEDGIGLIHGHPGIYEFFDENSKYRADDSNNALRSRDAATADKENYAYIMRLPEAYRRPLLFRDKKFHLRVIPDEVLNQEDDNSIENGLVERYKALIEKGATIFNKKYEYAKLKRGKEHITQVGAFE